MPSFKLRSYEQELLDGNGIPFADIKKNMEELDRINSRLGGHKTTIKGFRRLAQIAGRKHAIRAAEIGCGGGDNLRALKHWSAAQGLTVQLTGVDINRECVAYASGLKENSGIEFICSDYRDIIFVEKPHIIFSSLFCHHFSNEDLVYMLQWMKENSVLGFFINDLHRHPAAYHSIRLLTRLFSESYLVRNDAPLSVKRAFRKTDWEKLFAASGISPYHCQWRWAFRWLIIYHHIWK